MSDTHPKLFEVGINDGPVLSNLKAARAPSPLELTFGESELLGQSDTYVFYTPALVELTIPGMSIPQLYEAYGQESNIDLWPQTCVFAHDLFVGLIHPIYKTSYNRLLFAVPITYWSGWHDWLGTMVFYKRENNRLWRLRWQELDMVEPSKAGQAAFTAQPKFKVHALAIETNRGSFYFQEPRLEDPLSRYVVKFDESMVYTDTQMFAAQLNTDSPNPYLVE